MGNRKEATQEGQPGPRACPQNRLFVPPSLRSDVLQWANSSHLTCHPVIQRTIDVVQAKILVGHCKRGYLGLCQGLSRLQPSQVLPPRSCRWSPAAPACAPLSLVSCLSGLHHWPATIPWPHRHPDSGRPVQQNGPLCAPVPRSPQPKRPQN
ncbi:hypothetical protein L3Q82_007129 [Scortum barcoo]|uniref:Uncharacterized protein n=1 Tax=Scortum barcoo TaxID=214431 RepID=A0ACB8WTS9_9TELE|nr:hypothetical protein L3Q82_007129 [Scortum barcoo]